MDPEQVFSAMLASRAGKYKWFLRALRSYKYLDFDRGKFLESYYAYMRYVDDMVDGDLPLPQPYRNSKEFVEQSIKIASGHADPAEQSGYLLLRCLHLGEPFGGFRQVTEDILSSLLFDANRSGSKAIFPQETLFNHFYKLDIRGTVRGALKIFGEDPDKHELLEPLGVASRIFYNLRDLDEDLRAGYVNVAAEEIKRYGINLEDRLTHREYLRDQATMGLGLLELHKKRVRGEFKTITRMTFPLVYEQPARRYFEKVLRQ